MGSLKPGVGLVYERNGEEIYAREVGAPTAERKLIGYMYENEKDPRTDDGRPLFEHLREDQLWGQIRREARTNVTLQRALDRAIMIYKLSKDKLK